MWGKSNSLKCRASERWIHLRSPESLSELRRTSPAARLSHARAIGGQVGTRPDFMSKRATADKSGPAPTSQARADLPQIRKERRAERRAQIGGPGGSAG